jgi:SAM-dependent methyltransferase
MPPKHALRRMQRFWDRRAGESAFFFVDNRLDYRNPDQRGFWQAGEKDLERLLGALDVHVQLADVVVEIGCGVGRLTRPLARQARLVRALDVSPRMLDLAREHNPDLDNVEWLHGDGHSLRPIGSQSADACVSHVVFQHIADSAITLSYVREIGRVLRPRGWAAFQVSNDPAVHRRRLDRGRLLETMRSLAGRAPRGQGHPDWRGSHIDLGELRATAHEAGMEVERVVGSGTQFCLVLLRSGRDNRSDDDGRHARA